MAVPAAPPRLAVAFGGATKSPEITIREATAVAESLAPVVLWIDEIEKGFAATGSDARASRVFGSFLTWLSEKQSPVFVVATANDVTRSFPRSCCAGAASTSSSSSICPVSRSGWRSSPSTCSSAVASRCSFPSRSSPLQAERLSGAELEQVVTAGLYTAFSDSRDLEENDLANAIQETVPLYETYEERIKELRNWARTRARPRPSTSR